VILQGVKILIFQLIFEWPLLHCLREKFSNIDCVSDYLFYCQLCCCVVEYSNLNNALDEISAFMDVLEERNDHLFEKVQQLLQDSRHARLKAQVEDQESNQEKHSDNQQPTSSTDSH